VLVTGRRFLLLVLTLDSWNLKPAISLPSHNEEFYFHHADFPLRLRWHPQRGQRKKLKEGMELNTLKKVSDAQLTEAAFDMGRKLAMIVQKFSLDDKERIDSLQEAYKIRILRLQPGDSLLLALEQQNCRSLYCRVKPGSTQRQHQSIGVDSLLYTRPVMKQLPNGEVEFSMRWASIFRKDKSS